LHEEEKDECAGTMEHGIRVRGGEGIEAQSAAAWQAQWHCTWQRCGDGTLARHAAKRLGTGRWASPVCTITFSIFNLNFQICSNLQRFTVPLTELKKFKIKYVRAGNLIRSNFPHWSFSKFGIKFELQIKEPI
jgi:hypothetical protein